MITKSIEVDEAVWGAIRYYEMPFPEIYFMSGRRGEGYVVPKSYRGKILTPKALAFGQEHGGMLFYTEGDTMMIVEYELLRYRLAHSYHEKEKEYLREQIRICEQYGQVDQSSYFGEYPPPNKTPCGIVEDFTKIRNGMYFAKSGGQWLLGICFPIWHSELTIPAHLFGRECGGYLFYDLVTGAIPIFELMDSYEEIHNLVASEEDIRALLCQNFQVYVLAYNEDRADGHPPIKADKGYRNALDYLNFSEK